MADVQLPRRVRLGESVAGNGANVGFRVSYAIGGRHRLTALYVTIRAGAVQGTPAGAVPGVARVVAFIGELSQDIDLSNAAVTGQFGTDAPSGISGAKIADAFVSTADAGPGGAPIPLSWQVEDGDVVTIIVGAVVRNSDGTNGYPGAACSICLMGEPVANAGAYRRV